jgi:flagellar protein FliS
MSSPADTYRQETIETASPAQLITMLYDGAITAIHRAEKAIPAGRTEEAHRELTRAQDILLELMSSLDPVAGGTIAASLASLYEFCHHRLVEANLSKNTEPLHPVTAIILDIRQAWVEACRLSVQ